MSKQMPLSETLNELNAQLRQILNPDGDLPQIEATTHPTPSGSTETDNPAPVESGKRLSVPAKAGLGVLTAGLVLGVGGATANAVKPEWQLYDNSIGRILGSGSSATETVGTSIVRYETLFKK